MEIAVRIAQLLLSLSLLVIIHEFGHFITAKIFKMRVDKFYLFFDPWFSIFKIKRGETEYGVGWLPLGGYVKIAGMIDESMDTEALKKDPQPWEFRSKPAWQRLIVMVAGVAMNVILAMFIYAMIAFYWGSEYLPVQNCKYGISVDSLGTAIGLQEGDYILGVNNEKVEDFNSIMINLLLNDPKTLNIKRNDKDTTITVADSHISALLNAKTPCFSPRVPFKIAQFAENSPAIAAGFKTGDYIIGADSSDIQYYTEVRKYLESHKGCNVTFKVKRDSGDTLISMQVPADGKLLVYTSGYDSFFEFKTREYGFYESFPAGISKGVYKIKEYCKQWKLIVDPDTEAYKSVGSFISMAKIFPGVWDWHVFWSLTALFSIMLAVLNIFPIPALDGGHAFFLLIEIITGKKPSDKFMEVTQMIGMILLILLMVFAIGNDFIRHVFN